MSREIEKPIAEINLYKEHLTAHITKIKLPYRVILVMLIISFLVLAFALGYDLEQIANWITVLMGIQLVVRQ